MEFLTDPIFLSFAATIFGMLIKTFCPAAIPIIGGAKLAISQLSKAVIESEESTAKIKLRIKDQGLKLAHKHIEKYERRKR